MHDQNNLDNLPGEQQACTTSANSGASWCFGYSTVGGVSKAASASGAEASVQHQGVLDGRASAEGEPCPSHAETSGQAEPRTQHPPAPSRIRRRHRQPNQRKAVRTVRLGEDELALISVGAAASGMTTAGFLAHAALSAAQNLDRTAAEVAGDREIVVELFASRRHLSHIGNNINQVAKALNSGGTADHADAVLEDVWRAVRRMDAAVQQLVDGRNSHQR
ncbi:MobC family plasmid mobilization relaxosome protein [Streptomyces sp. ISL-86]|uniref:MobC family plasmid mobilization relaxosome protein n=1 Tax=Streptomyces sp. ISL-86 TaxID=2819187 RepID=UPI001BE60D0E|nr:MobC family plasmid mobilization relaxosome protein [Streptomyces sp. ISL-86]MBT2458268.1 MobC family plasmid mobilization relaxosome protein [Streptomyces sp. ISL-86]